MDNRTEDAAETVALIHQNRIATWTHHSEALQSPAALTGLGLAALGVHVA